MNNTNEIETVLEKEMKVFESLIKISDALTSKFDGARQWAAINVRFKDPLEHGEEKSSELMYAISKNVAALMADLNYEFFGQAYLDGYKGLKVITSIGRLKAPGRWQANLIVEIPEHIYPRDFMKSIYDWKTCDLPYDYLAYVTSIKKQEFNWATAAWKIAGIDLGQLDENNEQLN